MTESSYIEVPFEDERWDKPIHSGWMSKYTITLGRKCWRRRWFILNENGELWYFKSDKKREPCKDCVDVHGAAFWKSNVKRYCIEIHRDLKPFLFFAKSLDETSKWVEMLDKAGGIFDPNRVVGEVLPDICTIEVSSWSEEHVKEWLDQVPIDEHFFFSIYDHAFEAVDGKNLIRMRDDDLRDMGIQLMSHRRLFRFSIGTLKKEKVFNMNFNVVLGKILKMVGNSKSIRISQRRQLSMNLSDPAHLRESYLSLKDIRTLIEERKVFHEGVCVGDFDINFPKEEEEEETEGEEQEPKNNIQPSSIESEAGFLDFSEDCMVADAEDNMNLGDFRNKIRNRYPIKLVVTEVTKKQKYKTARKLLSPIISSFGIFKPEFGIFHTALMIGPWYLEWNNSSLVIPRRATSSSAIIAADVNASKVCHMEDEEMVKRLSEVICKWNTRKFYGNVNIENCESLGNCQQFVQEVLVSLGIQLTKTGCFQSFLNSMAKRGTCKMVFNPSKKLSDMLRKKKMKEKSITFETHKQLDKYVLKLRKVVGELALGMDFVEEMKLLKAFDRAFWLRFFKSNEDEKKYKPYMKKEADGTRVETCPFDDPRKTRSCVVVE